MEFRKIVTLVLFGGLILMAVGNALKNRGSRTGAVIESIGKSMYLLWAGAVVVLFAALIWLAFQFSR